MSQTYSLWMCSNNATCHRQTIHGCVLTLPHITDNETYSLGVGSYLDTCIIHLFGLLVLFARQQVCFQQVLVKAVTQSANADMICKIQPPDTDRWD